MQKEGNSAEKKFWEKKCCKKCILKKFLMLYAMSFALGVNFTQKCNFPASNEKAYTAGLIKC